MNIVLPGVKRPVGEEIDIASDTAWQGRLGSVDLQVQVPRPGIILAEWRSPNGVRQKTCKSVEELERSVLFQIMLSSGETDATRAQEIVDAVTAAEEIKRREAPPDRPERDKPRRKTPKARQHRRSRRPPRRR